MKSFTHWFATAWAESLGWALLHSLWQSLLILGIVAALFRFISKRDANTRYAIATGGLVLMLLSSIATFLFLYFDSSSLPRGAFSFTTLSPASATTTPEDKSYLDSIGAVLQNNITLLTACWMLGTLVFTLRFAGSWWYVSTLRSQASSIEGQWYNRLKKLSQDLNVRFVPVLAESSRITVPIVVGYLKPVILLPVGMIAGLNTDQIESILLHELSHIKRHDYLINLFQAVTEILLFFNPFVWMVSSLIRQEREHCCDDAVLKYSNPRIYATALAQLEEIRLSKSGLALALAENKNQLLNRIKRIMEKSVTNYSSREKLIPVLLLIIGLVCASWVSIHSQEPVKQETKVVPADTTKKKATRTFRYKSVTTTGEDGKPKEEIVQYYDSDGSGKPMLMMPPAPEVDFVPPVPPFASMAPLEFPGFPEAPMAPLAIDAIEWEAFGKEFESTFKERFGDFYEEHQEDFEKMMIEIQENFDEKFNHEWQHEYVVAMDSKEDALKHQAEAMAAHHEAMAVQHEAMEQVQLDMKAWNEQHREEMKALEQNMKEMEKNMQAFDKALTEQLIKDGYLKKGEKIKNIHWKPDGKIEINESPIKDADIPKYQKLHEKYFKSSKGFEYTND